MGYQISVADGVLSITVRGLWTPAVAAASLVEASRTARRHAARCVLLDLHQADIRATVADVYESTKALSKAFHPATWHAVVTPPTDPGDLGRFHETVAVNRGLQLRLFARRNEAEAWLREPLVAREAV